MKKNVSDIKGQLTAIENRLEALEILTIRVAVNEKKDIRVRTVTIAFGK